MAPSVAPTPVPPPPVVPQAAAPSVDAGPTFTLGTDFETLQQALGAALGSPVQDVVLDDSGCNAQQLTSSGLIYDECETGLVAFVASDGVQHWGLLNGRLLQWAEPTPDPPADAIDVAVSQAAAPAACGSTLEPGEMLPCQLPDSTQQSGILSTPGETNAYEYTAQDLSNDVVISLAQLPDDYDLYLADAGGTILASSVQDGLTPESIEASLPAGVYYIYVHVDDSQAADSTTPYVLQATLQPPPLPQTAQQPDT